MTTTLYYFPATSGFCVLLNQSINQSINRSTINQQINQSIDQSTFHQQINRSINRSINEWINQSINQSIETWKGPILSLPVRRCFSDRARSADHPPGTGPRASWPKTGAASYSAPTPSAHPPRIPARPSSTAGSPCGKTAHPASWHRLPHSPARIRSTSRTCPPPRSSSHPDSTWRRQRATRRAPAPTAERTGDWYRPAGTRGWAWRRGRPWDRRSCQRDGSRERRRRPCGLAVQTRAGRRRSRKRASHCPRRRPGCSIGRWGTSRPWSLYASGSGDRGVPSRDWEKKDLRKHMYRTFRTSQYTKICIRMDGKREKKVSNLIYSVKFLWYKSNFESLWVELC